MFIVEKNAKSIEAEFFRSLKTNVQYTNVDKMIKVITVTSANQGDGKTLVAGNLALVLAENKNKVLLIDCDLRRPTIHKKFNVSNLHGLTDLLIGAVSFEKARKKQPSGLHLLTSGKIPPNPSELLSSKSMKNLLRVLRNIYEYIIIDTPPIQAVSDSKVIGGESDGTILVVKANKTKKDEVIKSKKELEKLNIHIMGAVLNGVSNKSKDYKYYYAEIEENEEGQLLEA